MAQKISFLGWLSTMICSIYDDIIVFDALISKSVMSQKLCISNKVLYHVATVYCGGFLLGSVFWNIITQSYSSKKILYTCQLLLLGSMVLFLCRVDLVTLFILRMFQGVLASGVFICIYRLLKYNLTVSQFNYFINLNAVSSYGIETLIPISIGFLTNQSIYYSITFMIAIFCLSLYTLRIKFKDPPLYNLRQGTKICIENYMGILKSPLFILFMIAGICEGLNDTLINTMEIVLETYWEDHPRALFIGAVSTISICLSISVHLVQYFIARGYSYNNNIMFNWNIHVIRHNEKLISRIIQFILIVLLSTGMTILSQNYILFLIYFVITLIGLAIIHCICIMTLYNSYKSSSCVASSLVLSENLACFLIQLSSKFVQNFEHSYFIFIYVFIYILGILLLIKTFLFLSEGYVLKTNSKLDSVLSS